MKRMLGMLVAGFALAGALFGAHTVVQAQTPPPSPIRETVGVEGRITSPPPTQAATIVSPANGQSLSVTPVTVTGSCPANTLIKIFSNNVFVGAATCVNGSYTLQIALFGGRNDLVAKVFDALDQAGPDSATVTVNYSDPQFAAFGNLVMLTSQYARRAADPNTDLEWPLLLSGGNGPYALTIDWGDGSPAELQSLAFAGVVSLKHRYASPGVYRVIVRVADRNGSSSYLQLIAVANGEGGTDKTQPEERKEVIIIREKIMWEPFIISLFVVLLSFWLGRRYELTALRKKLEREYR
jgi:hypothetical protein